VVGRPGVACGHNHVSRTSLRCHRSALCGVARPARQVSRSGQTADCDEQEPIAPPKSRAADLPAQHIELARDQSWRRGLRVSGPVASLATVEIGHTEVPWGSDR
jgi:hypothetical protein